MEDSRKSIVTHHSTTMNLIPIATISGKFLFYEDLMENATFAVLVS
jgi:hypothetical protein